jgi:hypothetical protein
MSTIKDIVEDFADKLHALIESQAVARARTAVMEAFGVAPKRGPGRPPKALAVVAPAKAEKTRKRRKKAPLQLCPVPGCKNPAAPVFGMVCAKHKDLPKRLIKKYREARKAKKAKKAKKAGVKAIGKIAKKAAKKRAKRVTKKATKMIAKNAAKVSTKKSPKAPVKTAPDSGAVTTPSEAA